MPNNYGDVGPYGADNPYGGGGHSSSCVCGDIWRFEVTDFRTGRVKAVIHPISASWETNWSKPGRGQMVIATREYEAAQIFPDASGIFVSRVLVDDDGNLSRDCVFGGRFTAYGGSSGGATTIGLVTVDEYLDHRNIADADSGLAYSATTKSQTEIARDLIAFAAWNGTPLTALALPSAHTRDRNWQAWEHKNIGEAIQELVNEDADGLKYEVRPAYDNGYWRSVIRFADDIGEDRHVELRSDRDGYEYQVQVDAKNHATRVYGIGQGEEAAQLEVVAYDAGNKYAEFHKVVAWKDVPDLSTLSGLTKGEVVNFRDPVATPGMSIAGLTPSPAMLVNGDRLYVDIKYGLISFQGYCRLLSQNWEFASEAPLARTLGFQPEVRAAESVMLMPAQNPPTSSPNPPTTPTPGTPPDLVSAEPKPGLISQMQDDRITEASGMDHSRKW